MSPARLEAFSDGVLAVIITIMVLELRPPGGASIDALQKLIPGLLIYVLSFTAISIFWVNHHHLLRAARRISGAAMWANLHLLFWLSLVPVVTAWVGAQHASRWPTAIYGAVGLVASIAYVLLTLTLRTANPDTRLNAQLGRDTKATVSLALYLLGIVLALVVFEPVGPLLAFGTYAVNSLIWFIPDRRLA
jgi:uncharacterized membrane protein